MTNASISITKFDAHRAAQFAEQARIALAGYDACHELAACMLSAAMSDREARILVVGAGGSGGEIIACSKLETAWQFTALDPSRAMLDAAKDSVAEAKVTNLVDWKIGTLADVESEERFDAATLMGVLHHIPGTEEKVEILSQIQACLKPAAPLLLACNHLAYASQPLMLKAWANRWRMHGLSSSEIELKLAKILEAADPPTSESAVVDLLTRAGFETPLRFFSSLYWSAWISWRGR